MTSRISSPDTNADHAVRNCLDAAPMQSFIMVAGAGSGKTTSLVKALAHIVSTRGLTMLQSGQRVACITYTEVAVEEIAGDVAHSSICHVSTIHSFLWTLIRTFTSDIRDWLKVRIREKIAEEQAKLENPRTRAETKIKAKNRIERLTSHLDKVATLQRFTYTTGSDYCRGVLGHDDVVKCALALIATRPLLAKLLAATYPIVFIDESQDTIPEFVAALRAVQKAVETPFCLGFFGDPMQKIYLAGIGAITAEESWRTITKEENFRSPKAVLSLINRIRKDDDRLVQTRGRLEGSGAKRKPVKGTARLFLLPTDEHRTTSLARVRKWVAAKNVDQSWLPDADASDVKVLVLVHRSAASRLGFTSVYAALNDHGEHGLKQGLRDGTAVLRPFLNILLPLVDARKAGKEREIMQILCSHAPALDPAVLNATQVADVLARIDKTLDNIVAMLDGSQPANLKDVLSLARECQILTVDERFISHLIGEAPALVAAIDSPADDESEESSVIAFLAAPAGEMEALRRYIHNLSPFDTHQGIKGSEFDRVLVVLDDEESKYNLFSYGRYFGLELPSKTDIENARTGKETTVDRTRRLFYVCCSRARLDLAVALFVADPEAARNVLIARGIFPADHILTLDMLHDD